MLDFLKVKDKNGTYYINPKNILGIHIFEEKDKKYANIMLMENITPNNKIITVDYEEVNDMLKTVGSFVN